jgi:hypothetical protein
MNYEYNPISRTALQLQNLTLEEVQVAKQPVTHFPFHPPPSSQTIPHPTISMQAIAAGSAMFTGSLGRYRGTLTLANASTWPTTLSADLTVLKNGQPKWLKDDLRASADGRVTSSYGTLDETADSLIFNGSVTVKVTVHHEAESAVGAEHVMQIPALGAALLLVRCAQTKHCAVLLQVVDTNKWSAVSQYSAVFPRGTRDLEAVPVLVPKAEDLTAERIAALADETQQNLLRDFHILFEIPNLPVHADDTPVDLWIDFSVRSLPGLLTAQPEQAASPPLIVE